MDDLGFEEIPQDELDELGFEEVKKEEGSFLNDLSMDPTNTLLDVAGDVGTKVSSFARGIPVAGKAAEDIGATLAGMSKEEGAEFFQREDEQNPGNIIPQVGGAIASMAPMGIAPALAASAADMTMRDTPARKMALNLGLEGALGGLGKLVGKAFTKAGSEATKEAAERNAIEALDPTSEQIGKMLDEGDYLAKGRTLLDEGILKDPNKGLIRGLRDKEDILATLNSKKDTLIKKLEKSNEAITQAGPDVPGRMDLAQKLKNLAGNQRDKLLDDSTARYYDKASDSFKTPEIKAAEKQIKDLTKMAQKAESPEEADILLSQADELHEVIEESQALDFKSLTDIRKYLDGKAANAHKSQSKSTEHIRKVSNMVRDIEDDIAMGIDPDYKSIKHLLGQVNDLNKLAKSAAGKAEREALGGITAAINRSLPTILGTTVGAVGGPAGAAAGAIAGNRAGKIWAKYGPQFKAAGFDAANKLTNDPQKLKQLVDAAEKGGATAIGATHFKLMQEDPEYRKKYMKKKDK